MEKKIVLLLILMIFPSIILNAAMCDATEYVKYQKLAENVTYETSYSKSSKTFEIKLYNVYNGLYISFDGIAYPTTYDNKVFISDIKEGQNISFSVNTNDTGCGDLLKSFYINLPYYNSFYESSRCDDYKDKLAICSSQFLSYQPTNELFELQLKNYSGINDQLEEEEKDKTIIEIIVDFVKDWGVKILLVVISSIITIIPYNIKLRKIKHGI